MKYLYQFIFHVTVLTAITNLADAEVDEVRLNHLQVIGTHNSYHIEPAEPVMALIAATSPRLAQSIAYTHRPLEEQLGRLGIRQIELDLYADPEGGLFADPLAPKLLKQRGGSPLPAHDPGGTLKKPGLKIIHTPDFDYLTTELTFKHALATLRKWSKQHPDHVPIFVLLELKEGGAPLGVKPRKFDEQQLNRVDEEILSVFQPEDILSPDDVRGEAESLRQAIGNQGWPPLDRVRGKVIFALDNGGSIRDAYAKGHPSLKGRLLFASVHEEDPAAAWFKINDPVADFERIQRLVRAGFMVRTRADSGTWQARGNDPSQRDRALASGAQFISTDYPESNKSFSDYQVRFPGSVIARANPVSAPHLGDLDLGMAPRIRLATYNVLFGNWAEPERIGEMFKRYRLDIIGFNEVPGGDWTERVGQVLNMEYVYVGRISSANHLDKYKSILSRWPLSNPHEIEIAAEKGWEPASMVGAETTIRGVPLLIYSTHIPGRPYFTDQAEGSAAAHIAQSILPGILKNNLIIMGDMNNRLGDAPLNLLEDKGLRPIWPDLNIDTTRLSTHRHIESGRESGVIDHIYFSKGSMVRAVDGGVIEDAHNSPNEEKAMERYHAEWKQYKKPLSDHRPVWAILQYP